jgi:hypothetical protein
VSALEAALAGRPTDRPLLAPLFAALAAEVEELDVETFLADPGRRARIYADLARSLRPDVLIVDEGGDPPLVADLLKRVRAVVDTELGVVIPGPGGGSLQPVLTAARSAAEAGARVIFVREDGAMPEPRALAPLWGSLQFFRAVGVLKAPWAGELPRGPFLPCVTEPIDAPHALAVAPGDAAAPGPSTALVTHTEDLAGHVPIRDLHAAVAVLGRAR